MQDMNVRGWICDSKLDVPNCPILKLFLFEPLSLNRYSDECLFLVATQPLVHVQTMLCLPSSFTLVSC
jgi:hypothetical protein